MPDLKALFQIPHDSGLPQDVTVNTWCFGNVNIATATDMDDITEALREFYDDAVTTHGALSALLSPTLASPATLKFYDLASPEPRAPIRTEAVDLTNLPGSGSGLPAEVALCLSFQGVQISGEPQARRRGRLYIGPFRDNADTNSATTGAPGTELRELLTATAQRLLDTSNAATWYWAVHSPTNNDVVTINNGWVDNAWDTQRRRGIAATSRLTFTT